MHALYASLQDVSSPFRKGYFASMKLFIIGRTGKGVEYQELSVLCQRTLRLLLIKLWFRRGGPILFIRRLDDKLIPPFGNSLPGLRLGGALLGRLLGKSCKNVLMRFYSIYIF